MTVEYLPVNSILSRPELPSCLSPKRLGIVTVADLKSLSNNNFSIWIITGLVSVPLKLGYIFLTYHTLNNFGLYPEHCEYYVVETLCHILPRGVDVFVSAGNELG